MTNREDLESYFIRMGVETDEVDDNMWVLKGGEGETDVVVTYAPPVVVLRLKVMDLPEDASNHQLAGLFRKLLELNSSDLVHGSSKRSISRSCARRTRAWSLPPRAT